MEYLLIPIVALLASALTFFSGFGLGTLLLPAFALFFPVDVAIALTAIVHFLNNTFKFVLVKNHIDWKIAVQFGIPALIFAFLGAFLLDKITNANILSEYTIQEYVFQITLMKVIVAVLLILFALFELLPKLKNLQFPEKYLPIGGILSGFFGGLSGHQGALRSAFLTKVGLSKEAFIATGVLIACMIDISRMSVYFTNISKVKDSLNLNLLIVATLAAFIGVYFGNKLVKKITITTIQKIVAFMIIIFAIALGLFRWVHRLNGFAQIFRKVCHSERVSTIFSIQLIVHLVNRIHITFFSHYLNTPIHKKKIVNYFHLHLLHQYQYCKYKIV